MSYKVRPFSVCSSDTLLACALASVGQFLRLWFFKEGFSVLGRSFPFSSLIGIFVFFLLSVRPLLGPCNNPHQKKVSFGAWLLGRNTYDCIWLAKFPQLLCIEIGSQKPFLYVSILMGL